MSQKASAATIGAFILGAVALLIVALLTFGSGKFFKNTQSFILYFQGNTKGLNIGAPASFRGVKIGSVQKMQLLFDHSANEVYVGVVVEIDNDAFHDIKSLPGVDKMAGKDEIKYLIKQLGLRAKLASLSLVTGQLYIEFDFYPDSQAHLFGFDFPYKEFPTLPSTMEELESTLHQLFKTIRELPLRDLVDQLTSAVDAINSTVTSQAFKDIPEQLSQTLVNVRDLAGTLNKEMPPLTHSLRQTSDEADAAIADFRIMMREQKGEKIVRLAESIEAAADQAKSLLKKSEGVVSSIDTNELESVLEELSRAAVSVRILADYLDRHPEALLRGKRP